MTLVIIGSDIIFTNLNGNYVINTLVWW